MSAPLRLEVERQLLVDLAHHRPGSVDSGLVLDWSNPCQEGHQTEFLGGILESMSDVAVRNASGATVAEGWIDFIHGGGTLPLVVFWLFLELADGSDRQRSVKSGPEIPEHVWAKLSDESRDSCTVEGRYDAAWSRDPRVVEWKRRRRAN
ncbi:MAG: hypothetical protein IT373_17605 [Polyangiaceae bacterium]|nr:hypothetical protein [Polyangiaceae bacterium]